MQSHLSIILLTSVSKSLVHRRKERKLGLLREYEYLVALNATEVIFTIEFQKEDETHFHALRTKPLNHLTNAEVHFSFLL
jgi:hypothetical protein